MIPMLLDGFSLPIVNPTWIFFVVLLIILLAPLLFERLRIPQIVGMIIAGTLVGPHGAQLLTNDSSFELFGQVGLYYIMFLAGLSMDMGALKRERLQVVTFSVLSFAIPFVLGVSTSYYILHFNLPASFLVACVLSSHTLVSFSVVSRFGLTRHKGVTLSVVATMISLILALLVLAGIAGTFQETVGWQMWAMLALKCAAYLSVLFFVYPRLIRYFFKTFSDGILQYIFVLALVFLSAATSQALGLEGVLGAFLAGLVFNRYIPETVPLMRHIDFVGNALFIPYFLISVGMMINLPQIFSNTEGLVVVVVVSLVGLFAKWLAAFVTTRIFRFNNDILYMMTGLTTGHAAGALAMLMVGRELYLPDGKPLVNDVLMGAVVLLILISCVFSAVVTTQASKRISLNGVSEEEKQGEEDKIMVAFSNPQTIAQLVHLSLMMRPHRSTAPLVGVKLVVDAKDNERELESARQMVKEASQIAASAGVNMKKVVRSGINVITALSYTMKDFDVSEIIIGYHWEGGKPASSFGNVISDLLLRITHQIIIASPLRPVNTLRRIHVVVPMYAELEVGFQRWLMHVSRLARQLDCQITFYSSASTWNLIQEFCHHHYKTIRMTWSEMNESNDFLSKKEEVHDDHLLVLVAAREGSLSYQPDFQRIPEILTQSFAHCSKMLIFPDQYGIETKKTSFSMGFPSGNYV